MPTSETPHVHEDVDAEPADARTDRRRRIGYRRLPSDQRRDEIIEAAITTFSENPDASLGDVAATAGTSRTSVYRFFGNRQELLTAAFRAAGEQLLEHVRDAPLSPPSQALLDRIRKFFDYIEEHQTTFVGIVTWKSPLASDEISAVAENVREELCRMTYQVLKVEQPTPLLELTVRSWVAGVEDAALNWLETRHPARCDVETVLSMHLGMALFNVASLDPVIAERVDWWLGQEPPDGYLGRHLRLLAGMFTVRVTANVARLLAHGDGPPAGA